MYIRDEITGEVRKYGRDHHDSLRVSEDGKCLYYSHLQNGEGSEFGAYAFCDKDGFTPEEDEVLVKHGADAYFNIGGFHKEVNAIREMIRKYFHEAIDNGDDPNYAVKYNADIQKLLDEVD